jgi:hypothetical protein
MAVVEVGQVLVDGHKLPRSAFRAGRVGVLLRPGRTALNETSCKSGGLLGCQKLHAGVAVQLDWRMELVASEQNISVLSIGH